MKYLLLGILFITTCAFGQSDDKSSTILDKVSAEIKGLSSFYIEFSTHTENPLSGVNINQNGFGYVKGEKYFAALGNTTIISNGFKQWTVVKDQKVTYQSDVNANKDMITPKKLMTIWENGFKSKYSGTAKINETSYHQIGLFPTHPEQVNYHTIILYVNMNTNELYRAIMKTKNGGVMTYTIKQFVKNKAVNDTKFVYNPKDYPGYKLIRD